LTPLKAVYRGGVAKLIFLGSLFLLRSNSYLKEERGFYPVLKTGKKANTGPKEVLLPLVATQEETTRWGRV
jgi:hypothetical protein